MPSKLLSWPWRHCHEFHNVTFSHVHWYGNKFAHLLAKYALRVLVLENSNSTLFYHSKKSLYHYTIPFYNISSIPKLYFYLNIIFLSFFIISFCHFFSAYLWFQRPHFAGFFNSHAFFPTVILRKKVNLIPSKL